MLIYALLTLTLSALTFPTPQSAPLRRPAPDPDESAIARLIADGYVTAVFITRDEAAVRRTLHPEFQLLVLDDGELLRIGLDEWLEHLELDGIRSSDRIEHRIADVTVTGDAASARVEIWRNGAHIYTDHFLLYRFPDSGWRIVAKTFHDHD